MVYKILHSFQYFSKRKSVSLTNMYLFKKKICDEYVAEFYDKYIMFSKIQLFKDDTVSLL